MLRDMICSDLGWAGIAGLDRAANEATIRGQAGEVQAAGSRVKVRGQLRCPASGGTTGATAGGAQQMAGPKDTHRNLHPGH